ncbi:MAG: VWA domain-containing protein [Chiayiivirga sp.]|jgi:Ca-activated chloride channel family protein|uniref:vWA domain-containing protein n=1 Tax=Chiayiivirga sp. TaxID=2041042 RepID=UPI0025B8245A|nr:VWA domain-containing protein [Chiayiivirga sp.]MCI1728567.1 VWA domain-containing protein [Chiayiivirga sp.]
MFELLWPLVLLSLPLPLLVRRLLPPAAEGNGAALRVPFFGELETLAGVGVARGSSRSAWAWLAWALLCLAAARPQWVGEAQSLPMSGRDLMLAVDVSGSMAAEDMEIGGRNVDRLAAVKVVLGDFLQRRIGDRVGLVLFGQFAYQMTPLTFDRNSVRYQLETSAIGLAGRETAIGDAIGLAVKRLRQRPSDQRVLILLTDGVNTAGQLPPLKAAEIAQAEKVRVYTVAIGGEGGQMRVFGMPIATPGAEIDEATLEQIAKLTGGQFFRARDTAELAGIYAELDRLEPAEAEGESLRPRSELFPYPLLAALLLAALPLLRGLPRHSRGFGADAAGERA